MECETFNARIEAGTPPVLHLDLPPHRNAQDEPVRVLATWLLGEYEGGIFFSGRGGTAIRQPVPAEATGIRLRRWPSEGLAPEYLDWRFDGSSARR